MRLILFLQTSDCPICHSMSRTTEFNPPLLHVMVPLPALIGGYWLSERCESSDGGIWSRRQFQIYSGDKLWTGRWEYYDDPRCSVFMYAITAAGSYIQRNDKQHREKFKGETFVPDSARFFKRSVSDVARSSSIDPRRGNLINVTSEPSSAKSRKRWSRRMNIYKRILRTKDERAKKARKLRRSLSDNVYHFLFDTESSSIQARFAAMLRGHQVHETTTRKPTVWDVPFGDTELDLHIAESILIPADPAVANRCDADRANMPLTMWPRNCVPRVIEAPSIMRLRAKMSIGWNGQYILLLGLRDDNVWDAPLRQCGQIPLHNPSLRAHLRRSVGLRFGLLSVAPTSRVSVWLLMSQLLMCYLLYHTR